MSPDHELNMVAIPEEILARVEARGVNRRDFIKFCTMTTAALALPVTMVGTVAAAVADARLPVIWVEYQSCSGDSEAFLRANQPTAGEIILDLISLEYSEVVMAAAGMPPKEEQVPTQMVAKAFLTMVRQSSRALRPPTVQ